MDDSGARIIIDNILSEDDYISNEEDTLSEVKRNLDEIQGKPGGSYKMNNYMIVGQ